LKNAGKHKRPWNCNIRTPIKQNFFMEFRRKLYSVCIYSWWIGSRCN
jgi:hypothetical protein